MISHSPQPERPKIIRLYSQPEPKEVIYEFPLSERFRFFLRLEALQNRFLDHRQGSSPSASLAALEALCDTALLFERNDLCSELRRELHLVRERLETLSKKVEGELYEALQETYRRTAQLEEGLFGVAPSLQSQSGWLADFEARRHLPAATLSFDLPALHRWLHRSPEERERDLDRWSDPFQPFWKGLNHLLALLRESRDPSSRVAKGGTFQESLKGTAARLVRISVGAHVEAYPEMVASRHRLIGRFLRDQKGGPVPVKEDIPFQLTLCAL